MLHRQLPRRLAAAALAAALLMTPASAAFSDTQGHWAEGMINTWSEQYQVINGYEDGTFRPDDPITRGAFAGILDRLMQFQKASPADTFTDTPGTFWEEQILKLHASGIYLGNEGKALPGDSITRQQAVTMIARAFSVPVPEEPELYYSDESQIAGYARGPVAAMTDKGYITDCWDGNFRPLVPITRAEFVNIMGNMIQVLVQNQDTHTGEVFGTVMVNAKEGATLENMMIHGDLIIAPGVLEPVQLRSTAVAGAIYNFSGVEPVTEDQPEPEPEQPQGPGKRPEEVYTPGVKTGETFLYDGKKIPVYEGVEKSKLKQGDFHWAPDPDDLEAVPDRLEYVGEDFETRFGIDVAVYQNNASPEKRIDWDAVKHDGVDFAFVRVGGRGYGTGRLYEDTYYRQNLEGAMEAGLDTGVYFFSQAITVEEAIEEADYVVQLLKGYDINLPVAYDWEMKNSSYRVHGTTPEMATACAVAFCQRVEEAGYDAMVYASTYVNYLKLDQGAIRDYARWFPEYKSQKSEKLYPQLYYQMDYWQFTDKCKINGIGGPVDANLRFLPK